MAAPSKVYLAVDLGASSGRVVAGVFDGQRLSLEDVHRFENGGVQMNDRLYWDLPKLWSGVVDGLRIAAGKYGTRISSIGVDTWGVDFGLLDRNDELLGNPYCYRDRRTSGIMPKAFARASRDEIFEETGLQFMEFNTLYQLAAMRFQKDPVLDIAHRFLMIPDLFHWLLSGEKCNEYSNATTTQFYNPRQRDWSRLLLRRFELPEHLFGEPVLPGTKLGGVRASVRESTGLGAVNVVVPGTHDTASAVMAVPSTRPVSSHPEWCYISSGTWSLMGVEVPDPIINAECRQLNFTNEGGVGGTTRLLKNIAGLWLVQECRRSWKMAGRDYDWSDLTRQAESEPSLNWIINPDHPSLVSPSDMPTAIGKLCVESKRPVPTTPGQFIRCALESLALRYRMVLESLESLSGGKIRTIHIVGGGTQNRSLCQMTADACQRDVVAGPVEATAIGNLMSQAIAAGDVGSIAQAREIIRSSFPVDEYSPAGPGRWDAAFETFRALVG